jgi:hypothetical protein
VRIHLAAKHALQFELAHLRFELRRFALDVRGGGLVVFCLGELQQFRRIRQRRFCAIQFAQFQRETRAFTPQFLRPARLCPDVRDFQLEIYFLEPFLLVVVFKGTP